MKYIIYPDKQKTEQFFSSLKISDAENSSLVLFILQSIVIDTDLSEWTFVGIGDLTKDLQNKIAKEFVEKFNLKKVNFNIQLPVISQQIEEKEITKDVEDFLKKEEKNDNDEIKNKNINDVKDDFNKAYNALYSGKNKDLIFGTLPKGKVKPLSEITEEMNRVVVEGKFIKTIDRDGNLQTFSERILKSGAVILTFNLVDDTNGIYVRLRFPLERNEGDFGVNARRECNEFKRQLKIGMHLRISGNVVPDKYMNDELVFEAKGILIVNVAERIDNAKEKRVELHCHTKMSKLDGITPVEDLVKKAINWNHPALAITDHGVVQAFPYCMDVLDAENKRRKDAGEPPSSLKLIFGMEGYLISDTQENDDIDREDSEEDVKVKKKNKIHNFHIILLAKNYIGLRNLYKLVTISHLRHINRNPLLPRDVINEHREGLIIGSACEAGELYRAILREASDTELEKIASFYDYLEIQPLGNNEFLVRENKCTQKDLQKYNKKIYELGKKLGKLVVATGDVHFLNPDDAKVRAVLQAGQKYKDADNQAPLYFRTTEEMLQEFSYFGEEIAKELVITNPQKIADMVENIRPVPDRDQLYSPHIDGAEEKIKSMAYAKAHALYGEELPKIVAERLKMELDAIINHGFAVLYYIAHKLVKRSLEINYMVGSRGSVGSSFVATMIDITEVNSLPPHYHCPKCCYSEFFTNGEYDSGFDLPHKNCPECGTDMLRDGHNIPFAVFMGFHGDKVPDIDLNFSEVAQHYAHEYTKELFGRDNVCRAGTISTIAIRTAIGFAKSYFETRGIHAHPALIASIVERLQGVKRTTGQHPGGIMVVPRDMDIHYITPMNFPSNEKKAKLNILGEYDPPTITTHFDYHSINDRLVKLDILGHDDPGMIRHLEEIIPNLSAKDIPFGDPDTMAIFTGTQSLGVTPEQIGCPVGTFGIPECGTAFVRQMIADVQPTKFSDVVRISGYSHGTDVWLNNAQDLIREGKPVVDTISTRDDVMTHLIQHGVEPSMAFKIMEYVRKGNAAKYGLTEEMKNAMQKAQIPDWYIKSCETIQYLFPKAHAVAYVMMAYRIAYCKVHYPKQFYAAYFSERADLFDSTIIIKGKDYIKKFIKDTEAAGFSAEKLAKASLPYLELVVEMMERGFVFEPMDLYKSDSVNFKITENGLRPPLISVPGVGIEAAKALGKAVEESQKNNAPFLSKEDLISRSGVGQAVVEKLAEVGALGDLPESNAMSLF